MTGLALAQVGEFSLIIAQSGFITGILPFETYQTFLIVALITMAVTPFVIGIGPPVAGWLCKQPALSHMVRGTCSIDDPSSRKVKKDHLVIIGYGVTGRNLARTASRAGIDYTVIELNPDLVKELRRQGELVIFGDATSEGVLTHAGILTARIAVVAINDPVAVRRIVSTCRSLSHELTIIVRTRYVSEVEALYATGADDVIAEEFETSVEIFTVVLNKYFVPRDRIESFINEVRADGYQMLRSSSTVPGTLTDLVRHIPEVSITTITVEPGSLLAGITLGEINLRKRYNLLVLAIHRGEEIITGIGGETRIEAGDSAIIYAKIKDVAKGAYLFKRQKNME
jgi:CPA2 family monovalent cation:H+ antiporter-2